MTAAILHRRAVAEDIPFILDSWKRAFHDSYYAGLVANEDYHAVYGQALTKILARPGCEAWVSVVDAEGVEGAEINGWIVIERGPVQVKRRDARSGEKWHVKNSDVLHYMYVKWERRRGGLAKALLAAAGFDTGRPFFHTGQSVEWLDLVRAGASIARNARHNPLIARYPKRAQEMAA